MAGGAVGLLQHDVGLLQHDEALLVVEEAGTVRQGGAAGGCGAVYDARRLAGGGRRCSGSTCQQKFDGGEALERQLWTRSGGRSRLAASGSVLAFSWTCVLALPVCGWWYTFFLFLVTTFQGCNLVIFFLLYQ
uniref:Uncharacterized protein n=1 Tax=Oryza barthii TaxID=65489 RepID=A0A0D3F2Q8_9ORYZ